MNEDQIQWVEILATFNMGDLAFVKSVLQAHDIRFYVEGENFALVRPLIQPALVKVDIAQKEQAQELLKDFQSGPFGYQPDD